MVHCSMVAKMSLSRPRRASGVAYPGSAIHSSRPMTVQILSQTVAWVMK